MQKKNLWKIAACAVAVAGVAFLAGCGGSDDKKAAAADVPKGQVLSQIKQKGKIVVGTAPGYPPYEFWDATSAEKQVIGIDVEISKKLAEKLGVKLEIQDMTFQALLSSLIGGKIDIAIAGINPTDERRKTMDFSDEYLPTEQRLIIRKADAEKYKTLDDFTGKAIGVQKSSTQEHVAQTEIKDAKVVSLTKVPDAILELKEGKVDGVIAEGIGGLQYLIYNDDLMFTDIHFKNAKKSSAAALAKGNEDLLKIVNEVLKENTENGNIEKWKDEYVKKSVENAK